MPKLYIYETNADLAPLDRLQVQCDIVVGAMSLRERAERKIGMKSRVIARKEMERISSDIETARCEEGLFLPANCLVLSKIPVDGPEELGVSDGRVVYMRLGKERASRFDLHNPEAVAEGLNRTECEDEVGFVDHPWDVVRLLEKTLPGDCKILAKELSVASESSLGNRGIILDEASGPVVISADAVIEPFAYLAGPLFVGSRAVIKSHAAIRSSYIGAGARVGGEITCSSVGENANKQHFGFLGHSVVSSWVNIGAGATGSNLKNTYGEIKVDGGGTGLHYFGQIIGEHTKIGIMSVMNTGSIFGIGSNLFIGDKGFAGALPKRIGDFRFGDEIANIESVLATARAVLSRRGRELVSDMEALLRLRHQESN